MTWWTLLLVPGVGCLAAAGWQWRRLLRDRREGLVLDALRGTAIGMYGPEIADETGLPMGVLYPILARLEMERVIGSQVQYFRDGSARRLYRYVIAPEKPWRPLMPGGRTAPPDEPGGAA